jgi:hypothetical protein
MKPIKDLNLGFSDAENYKRSSVKTLFNQFFVRTEALDKLCSSETFFLIGEKGTGKTAYSVYLSNNEYHNTHGKIAYIRETEYRSFVALKRSRKLELSDFVDVWKVILCLLLAQGIREKNVKGKRGKNIQRLELIQRAIDTYYNQAFKPEIAYALDFLKDSSVAADLIFKSLQNLDIQQEKMHFDEARFQSNLLFLQRQFEEALGSLKLQKNEVLFIDGIDIRPSSIPYGDYLDCIRALANAVWALNNDVFPRFKDTPGKLKVVLLIRPDIFVKLGLQNQNAKIRDNSVFLDWRTTYKDYRSSALFQLADRILSSQQEQTVEAGESWDCYFPFKRQYTMASGTANRQDDSFISVLRFSLYRPRDIITMLTILRDVFIDQGRGPTDVFQEKDFDDPDFRRQYADYLLGEIKDHLAFYYSDEDYELFLNFFQYLDGMVTFTYDEYLAAFSRFELFARETSKQKPAFFESPDAFLQFLYELNLLSYSEQTEDEKFFRWCFRERTYSNIAPKVKTHERYGIHYGIARALNAGKRIVRH